MADYGVPADVDGALPWAWAEARLVPNRNYWVVTASAAGRPHAMPVWGVWMPAGTADPADRFWFSCAPTARKVANLAANPQCVVAVDDTVECVSVEGLARRVDAADPGALGAVDAVVGAYLAKYWPDEQEHASMDAFLRANALFEVTPRRAFGVIERPDEFAARATRWRW